jgi:hypothetical protein
MRKFLQSTGAVIFLLLLFSLTASELSGQSRKKKENTDIWKYEIEGVQTGVQGTYLIKVWSYSPNANLAIEQAKKNAVHGIIFRGFAGTGRVPGQRALATNPNLEEEKHDFFRLFFAEGGKYLKFVSLTNDGAVAAEDRLRVGKEYKIGVIMSVNVDALRKDLEEAGIIKSLGRGF